jgi:hypothetical protein
MGDSSPDASNGRRKGSLGGRAVPPGKVGGGRAVLVGRWPDWRGAFKPLRYESILRQRRNRIRWVRWLEVDILTGRLGSARGVETHAAWTYIKAVLKYRSARSGSTVTMLPSILLANSRAAQTFAPDEMPTSNP